MNDSLSIERDEVGTVLVLSFNPDEQLRDPDPLKALIMNEIESGHANLLLDLENVTYVSSSVLGLFITVARELKNRQGAIKLLNPQPGISNVFRMTRLDRVFEMFNDRDTALNSF